MRHLILLALILTSCTTVTASEADPECWHYDSVSEIRGDTTVTVSGAWLLCSCLDRYPASELEKAGWTEQTCYRGDG